MLTNLFLCLTLTTSIPSWTMQESGVTTSIRGLSAVNAQVCWLGTKGGVARTIDGGKTWKFSAIGGDDLDFRDLHAFDISGEPSTGIFSLAFNGEHGLAIGGDYKKESEGERNLMTTRDGGLTWKLITKEDGASPLPFRSCVGFLDAKTVVVVGPSGTNISRDGGSSWEALGGEGGFHTMSIAGRTVWAAGAEGRVGVLTLK